MHKALRITGRVLAGLVALVLVVVSVSYGVQRLAAGLQYRVPARTRGAHRPGRSHSGRPATITGCTGATEHARRCASIDASPSRGSRRRTYARAVAASAGPHRRGLERASCTASARRHAAFIFRRTSTPRPRNEVRRLVAYGVGAAGTTSRPRAVYTLGACCTRSARPSSRPSRSPARRAAPSRGRDDRVTGDSSGVLALLHATTSRRRAAARRSRRRRRPWSVGYAARGPTRSSSRPSTGRTPRAARCATIHPWAPSGS